MKYIATIITSLAIAAVASAGTSAPMPSAGKGKAVVAPQPAPCPDMLKYSYLEAGWIRLDADDGDVQNGGYLDASYEVIPHLLVDGSVTLFEDSNQYTVGVGSYYAICSAFHLTGRTGYSYYDTDDGGSQNEWYISPGFRAMLTCNLELWGKVYINVDSDETDVSYGGGFTYHFCPHTGVTIGAAASDNAWSLQAGLRYQF